MGSDTYILQHEPIKVSNYPSHVGAEGQAVPEYHPSHTAQAETDKAMQERTQDVFLPGESSIEEGQPGKRHQHHQRRGGKDPCRVPRISLQLSWGGLLRSDILHVESRPSCHHDKADQKDRQNLFHITHSR